MKDVEGHLCKLLMYDAWIAPGTCSCHLKKNSLLRATKSEGVHRVLPLLVSAVVPKVSVTR